MAPNKKWNWFSGVRFHTIDEMPEANQVEVVLTYNGPDVDNGKMALDDLIPVLQGFGGSYSKLSAYLGLGGQHQLRITAVHEGSTNLVLDVWDTVKKNVLEHLDGKHVVEAATTIISSIFAIIKAKKHVDNKPYTTKIDGNNGTIQIFNSEQISLTLNMRQFGAFQEGLIDSDLAKVVTPLERGHVESSRFTLKSQNVVTDSTEVSVEQKGAFSTERVNATSTKEVWLTAVINSMTKSTNSGYVYLSDGNRVFYRMTASNPEAFYDLFSYRGPVRMRCIAYLDDSLRPVSLDVFEMIPEQRPLGFDLPPDVPQN